MPLGEAGWPVWGHGEAVTDLRRSLADGRLAHAYLVAGPAGIGKTALAMLFAQAACCVEPDRPDPTVGCGACLACRKIAKGVHPDVETYSLERQARTADKVIGKNTSLTIETVRTMCAAISLRPMEADRRFVIIDDAATMQGVAQEALLKTLEEPPSAVVIMVLTDDLDAILPTVRSRCRSLMLRPVSRGVLTDLVRAVAPASLTDADISVVTSAANGRPGWALRALRDPEMIAARRGSMERALGLIGANGYDRLVAAVRLGDTFAKRRAEVFTELEALLGIWRDALLLRAGLGEQVSHPEYADQVRDAASGWELPAVTRALKAVQICIADLESNVRPKLALEAMVLAWPTQLRP